MNQDAMNREGILETFHHSLQQWVCHHNEHPLTRWLARELDTRGTLTRLAIPEWHACLEALMEARRLADGWPASWDESVGRLIIATLRFSRPDGSPVGDFDRSRRYPSPDATLRNWVAASRGTELAKHLRQWESSRIHDVNFSPEAAAWEASKRVLSVLRDQVRDTGDFLAVDHRVSGPSCRFELFGAGRSWLGPSWAIDGEAGANTRPKPGSRISVSGSEVAEWSFRSGDARVTQTALLLGGRRLALLSALFEARAALPSSLGFRISLPSPIAAAPLGDRRGFRLKAPGQRPTALVIPIGLPSLQYDTARGAFLATDDALVLNQASAGRRCWLPLLVSWDSARNRKEVSWRVLTVSERSKAVRPGRAFAARVSWGRHESYVIYRSLGQPASRAFLGYRTSARFLIGMFTPDGNVTPMLRID
jgi:hypothetical protein